MGPKGLEFRVEGFRASPPGYTRLITILGGPGVEAPTKDNSPNGSRKGAVHDQRCLRALRQRCHLHRSRRASDLDHSARPRDSQTESPVGAGTVRPPYVPAMDPLAPPSSCRWVPNLAFDVAQVEVSRLPSRAFPCCYLSDLVVFVFSILLFCDLVFLSSVQAPRSRAECGTCMTNRCRLYNGKNHYSTLPINPSRVHGSIHCVK